MLLLLFAVYFMSLSCERAIGRWVAGRSFAPASPPSLQTPRRKLERGINLARDSSTTRDQSSKSGRERAGRRGEGAGWWMDITKSYHRKILCLDECTNSR